MACVSEEKFLDPQRDVDSMSVGALQRAEATFAARSAHAIRSGQNQEAILPPLLALHRAVSTLVSQEVFPTDFLERL